MLFLFISSHFRQVPAGYPDDRRSPHFSEQGQVPVDEAAVPQGPEQGRSSQGRRYHPLPEATPHKEGSQADHQEGRLKDLEQLLQQPAIQLGKKKCRLYF